MVPAKTLINKEPTVPSPSTPSNYTTELISLAKNNEYDWLNEVKEAMEQEHLDNNEFISWAAYHCSKLPSVENPPANVSLMPLFYENSHSTSMMLHGMHVVREAIRYLNPGQVPFITGDQPLYAIMKQCQWQWPEDVGENNYVVLMGGLHLKMAFMKMLGSWLEGSGWSTILAESEVTTPGRADNAVKGGNITRSRYFHQVTL